MKLKIALLGYGRMGKLIAQKAIEKGDTIVATLTSFSADWEQIEQADVVIDFSHPDAILAHCSLVFDYQKPLVIGTTGWEANFSKVEQLVEKKKGSLLYSPNFSLGMFYFHRLVEQAAALLQNYKVQGIEMHHEQKVDSPSGTAHSLSRLFTPPLVFTPIRLGHLPGTHTLLFDSPYDTITLTHEARSRDGFAEGAIIAAHWLYEQQTEGIFTLDAMVRSLHSAHNPL